MYKNGFWNFSVVLLLGLVAMLMQPNIAKADVSAVGDIFPLSISDEGGDVGPLLIIGNDPDDPANDFRGVAGLFMDSAPPLFGPLEPLEAVDGIIGNLEGSVGAVTLEDFLGGDLIFTNDFIVGNEGQGLLDMFDSASVSVTNRTTIGLEETGAGLVTINGQGTRIYTDEFIVGDLGQGELNITNRGVLFSGELGGDSIIGNDIGGVGIVTLTGQGTRWSVGNTNDVSDLYVGVLGEAMLKIKNQSVVQVSGNANVGVLGHIELQTSGRLRMLPSTSGGIVNQGVLLGNGYVDFVGSTYFNAPGGEISNSGNAIATDVNGIDYGTNRREKLIFTGNLLTNLGLIESNGGEMVFDTIVDNANNIVADDALLYFNDGLIGTAGTGDLILSGRTTVHGFISGNAITVLPGSVGSVVGGIQFSSPLVAAIGDGDVSSPLLTGPGISIAIGANPGSLTVIGDVNLAGGVLDLDVSSLGTPTMGDIFEIITIPGASSNFGAFDNSSVIAGGYEWLIDYDEDSVFVVFDGLSATTPGDFDGDGDVDGRDFLAWQRNPSLGDLADWQANFPSPAPITGGLTAVPEPSSMVLLLSLVGGLAVRRKRS